MVVVCQVGRRGWRADGIERGGSGAGRSLAERPRECDREMERRMAD